MIVAWLLVAGSCLVLLGAYGDLPDRVPTFRDFTGTPIGWARKDPVMVLRIGVMGIGQLGATTAMANSAASSQHTGWTSFWIHASLAVAGKTVVECVQIALGLWASAEHAQLFLVAALAPVALFLISAALLWRRSALTRAPVPRVGHIAVLAVSLALWLGSATAPSWLSAQAG